MKKSEMWRCEITVARIGVWENHKPTRPEAMALVERWLQGGFTRLYKNGATVIYPPSQIARIKIVPPRTRK